MVGPCLPIDPYLVNIFVLGILDVIFCPHNIFFSDILSAHPLEHHPSAPPPVVCLASPRKRS